MYASLYNLQRIAVFVINMRAANKLGGRFGSREIIFGDQAVIPMHIGLHLYSRKHGLIYGRWRF